MKIESSWLPMILLGGVSMALMTQGVDCWHHATNSGRNGIETMIEIDREYFRSMQSTWDKYQEDHPDWERPQPTSEEKYEQWREFHRTGKLPEKDAIEADRADCPD